MTRLRSAPLALAAALLLAGACAPTEHPTAGPGDGGTLVISTGSDADILFPPTSINPTTAQVSAMVFEHLAEPDTLLNTVGDEGWTGRLAASWTWAKDSLSIAFHLDPKARWHDGVPVRAADVRFTWQLYTDPKVGSDVAPLLVNIDSVSTPDSLTAVFWFRHRSPHEFFDAAFQMRILPQHVLAGVPRDQLQSSAFARHPIGSGPYRFASWVPRQTIELDADTTYHLGRPHIDRLIWSIAPDPNAALLRLLSGDADFLEYVPPPAMAQVAKDSSLATLRYPSLVYIFLLFNERDPLHPSRPHPIFGDRSVRRALTMAVDRERLLRSVYDTLAAVAQGPFTHAMASYDSALHAIPYDPDSARALLDAAGWRVGAGGIRARHGVPLRFRIMVPSSSAPRMQAAVLLQAMFKAVGAQVDIDALDFPTVGQRLSQRRFDAALNAMMSDGNPASIRQEWSIAAARAADGGNAGSYENPVFDALVDSAAAQFDPRRANGYYHRAYQVLADDAPAIWLFEPFAYAAMQRRIHPVGIRPDAWFANLNRWYIPANQRIARDRIGLAQARP